MAQKFKADGAELAESPAPFNTEDPSDSIHPGLHPSITGVPVTPGIHLGEYNYDRSAFGTSGYFTHNPANPEAMAQAPSGMASGEMNTSESLRRMSLSKDGRSRAESLSAIDPRVTNPTLNLSGGLISATFCIPHQLTLRKGSDWLLDSRRGTSALFDSFKYLSSDKSHFNHTLVGWTGEITVRDDTTPPHTPPETTTSYKVAPLNKSSAPIPVDAFAKLSEPPPSDGVFVSKEDQGRLEFQLAHDKQCKTVPVWLADEADTIKGADGVLLKDQARWRRFAEHNLYTMFHYKQHEPNNGHAERKSYADYFLMNKKFANRILEIYKPGDIVLIHDYHLMLLPMMLRQKIPNMYIGFFLHVPFPSSEFTRCLPRRNEILEGALAADLLGFQTFNYARHFTSCCTRILGFPSTHDTVDAHARRISVGGFPIGIDAAQIEKLAFTDQITKQVHLLKQMYEGKKIIVGRDRLDSVRGVEQKLMAFERFLELHPEWREKVVLIQVTSPTSVEEEKEDSGNKIANKVAALVAKINGLYGSLSFSPVQHYPQYLSQDEYLALLRAGDVGLITSVRDGMNTTSLEYVICQKDNHGPLILSEFSGTAGSLAQSIKINPWDMTGVATQINAALIMSEEKKFVMHSQLYHHVTTNNVQAWSNGYISRLLTLLSSHERVVATPLLDSVALVQQYRAAHKRLFMFDYDGTLTPIVKDPAAAVPSDRVLRTLKALTSDPQNAVWIISGRDQDFLGSYLGHINSLGFSAEHGSFMRHPGSEEWENLAEKLDMGWQKEVMSCFQKYTELTPGSFIERKRCALTWHYRPSDPVLGADNARKCQTEMEKTVGKVWDVEVMAGKANLEVRPKFINKGEIAKRLVQSYGQGAGEAPEFIICLGDDFTDEDMFRALNASGLPDEHIFTVAVGASSKPTLAKFHVLEPSDVISAVALLNGGDSNVADLGALAIIEGRIPEQMPDPFIDEKHQLPGGTL